MHDYNAWLLGKMDLHFMGAPKVMGLGFGGRVLRRVSGTLRGSLKVQGEIIMPNLTLDLRIAGSELFVNLDGRH